MSAAVGFEYHLPIFRRDTGPIVGYLHDGQWRFTEQAHLDLPSAVPDGIGQDVPQDLTDSNGVAGAGDCAASHNYVERQRGIELGDFPPQMMYSVPVQMVECPTRNSEPA